MRYTFSASTIFSLHEFQDSQGCIPRSKKCLGLTIEAKIDSGNVFHVFFSWFGVHSYFLMATSANTKIEKSKITLNWTRPQIKYCGLPAETTGNRYINETITCIDGYIYMRNSFYALVNVPLPFLLCAPWNFCSGLIFIFLECFS